MCCIYIHFVIDCLTFALYKHCRENCSSSQWCMHVHSPPALVPHRVKKMLVVCSCSCLVHVVPPTVAVSISQATSTFSILSSLPKRGHPMQAVTNIAFWFFLNSRIKLSVNAVVCVACEHQFGREMACTVHMLRSNFTNKSAITERQW